MLLAVFPKKVNRENCSKSREIIFKNRETILLIIVVNEAMGVVRGIRLEQLL
jgi:hypothetical protein